MFRFKALGVSVVALNVVLGAHEAWAQDVPANCDPKIIPKGIPVPLPFPLFVDKQNQTDTTGSGSPIALTGFDASTSQILELVSQRRLEESCPIGSVRVGGVCQPQVATEAAEPVKAPPPKKQPAATDTQVAISKTAKPPPKKKLVLTDGEKQIAPQPSASRVGTWAETFADYEKRTGATKQKQTTVGGVVGIDKTFRNGNSGVQVGLFGAYTKIQQNTTSPPRIEKDAITDYFVDVPLGNTGKSIEYKYPLPTDHFIESSARQSLDGLSLGVSTSFFNGGWFSDFVGKVDFFDVRGVTTVSDKFNGTLKAAFHTEPTDPDHGCMVIQGKATLPPDLENPPHYILSGETTEVKTFPGETTLRNYILANNFGHRFDLKNGRFWEPSAGIRFTYSDFGSGADVLGLRDGHALRLEAGARIGGAKVLKDRSIWTYTVGAYLYSDVIVEGLVITPTGSSFENDEGKVRVRGVMQSQLHLKDGVSLYGEVGGRYGEDYWGVSGKLGGRVEW